MPFFYCFTDLFCYTGARKYIMKHVGRVSEEKLWMRPRSFYQNHQIRFFMERVVDIEVDQHKVYLQSGQQVGYHRLLLATGARAKHLSRPGANLAGVTTLRTVFDY